jgi:hypothetical protein
MIGVAKQVTRVSNKALGQTACSRGRREVKGPRCGDAGMRRVPRSEVDNAEAVIG